MKAKGERKVKRLIERLIQWMEANGMSQTKIIECIKYILK